MDKHTLMTNLTAVASRLEEAQSTIFKLECQISDLRVYVYKERMQLLEFVQKIEEGLAPDSLEPQGTDNIIPTLEFKQIVIGALNEGDIDDIITDGVSIDYQRDGQHSMTFNAELDPDMSSDIIKSIAENLQDYFIDRGYMLTRKDFSDGN